MAALPLLGVALVVGAVETSMGPVDIGSYSLAGPRTWTRFAGTATLVCELGGYKLFHRRDPVVIDGT